MLGWKEISDSVLKYDYCCGCGVCAGVCPQNALEVRFSESGEYRPYLVGRCVDCGLCSQVCPFVDEGPDKEEIGQIRFAGMTDIRHSPDTGYYLDALIGHCLAGGRRQNAASGGLATWTLEALLRQGLIDAAFCVGLNAHVGKLFDFKVCVTEEQIRACSGSCYYPVEASAVIRHALANGGRYAIVGLPCLCTAIRRAQEVLPRLRGQIAYVLGLTCGTGKSRFFSEYICRAIGVHPSRVSDIRFRHKDTAHATRDFATLVRYSQDGTAKERLTCWAQTESGFIFCSRHFTPNACDFCDDVFAECADVAFMDAWLPNVETQSLGTSITLVRNDHILRSYKAASDELKLSQIGVGDVLRSQRGAMAKKHLSSVRARIAADRGNRTPRKWQCVRAEKIGILDYLEELIVRSMRTSSPVQWLRCQGNTRRYLRKYFWHRVGRRIISELRCWTRRMK